MISRARAQRPRVQREQLLQGKLAPDCESPVRLFPGETKRVFFTVQEDVSAEGHLHNAKRHTRKSARTNRSDCRYPRAKASASSRGSRGYYFPPRGYFHRGVHVRGLCQFIPLHHQSRCSAFPLLRSGVATEFTARLFQSIIVCYVGISKVLYATVISYIFTLL